MVAVYVVCVFGVSTFFFVVLFVDGFHVLSGKISSWIDLDSEDDILREDSEIALKQELAWASHLSLQV